MENRDIKSVLRFIDYVVENVEFRTNQEFEEKPVKIDFNIVPEFIYSEDEENSTFVILDVKIFENPEANNYPFYMRVKLKGHFEFDSIDNETRQMLSERNAVSILFPYLRSLVTTYTANSNVQPLILPPINVNKLLYRDSK